MKKALDALSRGKVADIHGITAEQLLHGGGDATRSSDNSYQPDL